MAGTYVVVVVAPGGIFGGVGGIFRVALAHIGVGGCGGRSGLGLISTLPYSPIGIAVELEGCTDLLFLFLSGIVRRWNHLGTTSE